MTTILDIETIALPIEQIEGLMPEFREEDVKLGNLKDADKIKLKIEAERVKHREKWIKEAALDARTSLCKLAGFMDDEGEISVFAHEENGKVFEVLRKYASEIGVHLICKRDESSFLSAVWERIGEKTMANGDGTADELCGYFIHDFDLPFLIRRMWIRGIRAKISHLRKGRYWRGNIVDIYGLWGMGEKFPSTGGLAGLA
jgi:hypothetical protein